MKAYNVKVVLENVTPEVTREFTVPANIDLPMFAQIIKLVMGWEDCHLSQFLVFKNDKLTIFTEEQNEKFSDYSQLLCWDGIDLSDVLKTTNAFKYEYDPGDRWTHDLTISEPIEVDKCQLINFENNCPPEDIGGADMYMQYLSMSKEELENSMFANVHVKNFENELSELNKFFAEINEEIIEKIKEHNKNGHGCCCGDHGCGDDCECGDDCDCGDDCQCNSNDEGCGCGSTSYGKEQVDEILTSFMQDVFLFSKESNFDYVNSSFDDLNEEFSKWIMNKYSSLD